MKHRCLCTQSVVLTAIAVLSLRAFALGQVTPPIKPATPTVVPTVTPATPSAGTPSGTPAVTTPPATTSTTPDAAETVRKAKLETIYLKDRLGELVPVLIGMSYEEFDKLMNDKVRPPAGGAQFGIQKLVVTGNAETERANLDLEITVQTMADDWVRIPLGMSQLVLKEPAKLQGTGGAFFLSFTPENGYVGWLRAPQGKPQAILLKAVVPLVKVGTQTRMNLSLPRATTAQLKNFRVKAAQAVVTVSEGVSLDDPKSIASDATELNAFGLGSDFQLTWREGGKPAATVRSVLEVSGLLLVRFDGTERVATEARLRVQSRAGEFDTFRVKLPPGAELTSGNQPRIGTQAGYDVAVVESKDPKTGKNVSQLVEVKLDRPSRDVEVRLATELLREGGTGDKFVDVSGFDVLSAESQWGRMALAIEGDWYLQWNGVKNCERVAELPESLRQENVVAGFEYTARGWGMKVQVEPRKKSVSAWPTYILTFQPDLVELDARITYHIQGKKVDFLDIDLPGWVVDRIEPASLVKSGVVLLQEVAPLVVPLSTATTGDFEIRVHAHRVLDPKGGAQAVQLPRPRVNKLNPAVVAVQAADNVELVPSPDEMTELAPAPPPLQLALAARQQAPYFYRQQGEVAQAKFVGTVRARKSGMSVGARSDISLSAEKTTVQQRLAFDLGYEKISQLELRVPKSLAASQVKVRLDGASQLPLTLEPVDSAPAPDQSIPLIVKLNPARQQACTLLVEYTLPPPKPDSADLSIPLVMPGRHEDIRLSENLLRITYPQRMQVQPQSGQWQEISAAEREAGLWLSAVQRAPEVHLRATIAPPVLSSSLVVEKVWVQSWLANSGRRDRAVYRIRGDIDTLRFTLPAGVQAADVDAIVDGQRGVPRAASDGKLLVELPRLFPASSESAAAVAADATHVVELWYIAPQTANGNGSRQLDLPQIADSARIKQIMWQLLLPDDQHLLFSPADMTGDLVWQWNGIYWGRTARLGQEQLADWVGTDIPGPQPEGVHEYLFTTFGELPSPAIWTIGRSTLLLGVAGGVLVICLALTYVPGLRHPRYVMIGLGAVVFAGLLLPEPIALMAQAGMVGGILAAVAWAIKRSVAKKQRGVSLYGGTQKVWKQDPATTEFNQAKRERGSHATTATAPAQMVARQTHGSHATGTGKAVDGEKRGSAVASKIAGGSGVSGPIVGGSSRI